jgi:YD repeat-containing protein
VGNRTYQPGVPYTYNSSNEMLTREGVPYTYDADGNLLSKTSGSSTTTYAWDCDGNNIIEELNGTGSLRERYTYGPGVAMSPLWG